MNSLLNLFFMLGSRTYAISNTSTFYTQELPNFKNVRKLSVLLLQTPGGKAVETCANGKTLKDLEANLKMRNISYTCEDNPKTILFLMCFQDPYSKQCQSVKISLNNSGILTFNKPLIFFIILFLSVFYNLFDF